MPRNLWCSTGSVRATFTTESSDWADAVAVQADGKIVAVGESNALGLGVCCSYGDFALARYTN